MEIRAHSHSSAVPKRKLNIAIQMQEPADLPHPVKINHLKESALPMVVLPAD
jgi:hypothetical protein